ncbi:uncharacterized protein SETTUDRAFT_167340 [Exserohilum turcica Et28A]|uniref:Uncharacterized protein n=1 Tax=Exserohilum turcicum (strain 28A) TaxID=671987 RepID=R0J0K5_EXST2|nr:uncharacterized protein SETTUDRAFT_167340 [Exserohilum turcica Et28A]EOA90510.1 hypothetical protein SETTUDRAFT_167340 [Exserohilum turcica Et28A]
MAVLHSTKCSPVDVCTCLLNRWGPWSTAPQLAHNAILGLRSRLPHTTAVRAIASAHRRALASP